MTELPPAPLLPRNVASWRDWAADLFRILIEPGPTRVARLLASQPTRRAGGGPESTRPATHVNLAPRATMTENELQANRGLIRQRLGHDLQKD